MTERSVYVLREEPYAGYNWNIGDHLIHAGVVDLLSAVGEPTLTFINRKEFAIPAPDADADMIVYAGMPQFAATDRASLDDQAWAMLRHRFPPPTPALNIGCGTGYALHVNRLRVAATMVAERYNQWFFDAQRDVRYLTRDPLSRHFLRGLGLHAQLGICPSLMVENSDKRHLKTRDVAIALVNPDIKFDPSQKQHLSFDLSDLFRHLTELSPEAMVICQEPADLAWAESFGIRNCVLPHTLDDFRQLCGSAKTLISTRVHASVSAFTQGVDVLHLAIDGRSDLLTPLMACGFWKANLFDHSLDEIVKFAKQSVYGYGRIGDWQATLQQTRAGMRDQFSDCLSKTMPSASYGGSVTLNAQQCARMRPGDIVLLTASQFQTVAPGETTEVINVPLDGRDGIQIFGPYLSLAAGMYDVDFDFEWWGRARSNDAAVTLDVTLNGTPLVSRIVSLHDLLTIERLPRLRFDNPSRASSIEFRVAFSGLATGLLLNFHGVCLTFQSVS